MSNPTRAIALAALVCISLSSCETVRTITGVESRDVNSELYNRFVGQSAERYEDGVQHSMNHQRIDTTDLFGGERENSQFGKSRFGDKKFAGMKRFTGDKAYQPQGFQFVKERELAREEAAVAGKSFYGSDKSAGEGSKRWFGRNKGILRNEAKGFDDSIDRTPLGDAVKAQDSNRGTRIQTIDPGGGLYNSGGPSISELKDILGR